VGRKNGVQVSKSNIGNRGDSSFGEFQEFGKGGISYGKDRAESSGNIFKRTVRLTAGTEYDYLHFISFAG